MYYFYVKFCVTQNNNFQVEFSKRKSKLKTRFALISYNCGYYQLRRFRISLPELTYRMTQLQSADSPS